MKGAKTRIARSVKSFDHRANNAKAHEVATSGIARTVRTDSTIFLSLFMRARIGESQLSARSGHWPNRGIHAPRRLNCLVSKDRGTVWNKLRSMLRAMRQLGKR